MYRHILISTAETGPLYSYDHEDIEEVESLILKPYLEGKSFKFNGYFIEPSKVIKLRVTQTSQNSKEILENCDTDDSTSKSSHLFNSDSPEVQDRTKLFLAATKAILTIDRIQFGIDHREKEIDGSLDKEDYKGSSEKESKQKKVFHSPGIESVRTC